MIKVFKKTCEDALDGEVLSFYSKRVAVGGEEEEYRSYESDNIRIGVGEDGHISFSNYSGEGFIYFYPDQLEHVKEAVDRAIKQAALTRESDRPQ